MPDIEDQIQKAIQEGKFNNLPGKGKPLRIDNDPLVDPEWRLAHHILKSSGYTLPWIESRQEILTEIAAVRSNLEHAWRWREKSLAEQQPYQDIEEEWLQAKATFTERIQAINTKISSFNLEAPSPHFQLIPMNIEQEITSLTTKTG